jgi:hypothetical protein
MAKVFWKPIMSNGEYGVGVRLPDITDDAMYQRANAAYANDPDYVSEMLDGRGYIYVQGSDGLFTYQQDSL